MEILIPIALIAVVALLAVYGKRLMTMPSVQRVKSAYPLINVAIAMAAEATNGTPYDFLLNAAAEVWSQENISVEEAAKLTNATVAYFDKGKYKDTNKYILSPDAIAQAERIASALVNLKNASRSEAKP